ncbi:hypothetical protein [Pseudofrankia asymbiotica]|uniref:Uncharacterized protein n=1 Tax=Pseudofrankia asymbiotica TaxID=1834516 RepID=A0A1V2I999_9ACTN|nr:hypothetical protein [Pseudofrankia asymbiotica]ONH28840.1 hypothetical protein BL253_18575 [Pseudofrankia asymbiotica]
MLALGHAFFAAGGVTLAWAGIVAGLVGGLTEGLTAHLGAVQDVIVGLGWAAGAVPGAGVGAAFGALLGVGVQYALDARLRRPEDRPPASALADELSRLAQG